MTTAVREPAVRQTPASRVLALAGAEVTLLVRNRTAAISSLFLPIALGAFFAFTLGPGADGPWGTIVALQLVLTFTMGVYITITTAVVSRRQTRVLKRLRTSGLSDLGVLLAVTGPGVAIALLHLVLYLVIDVLLGMPLALDPVPLLLAVIGGFALCVTAGFATANVTPTPERAQITTLPLFFVMFAAAFALPLVPAGSPFQAVVLVPGAPLGQLTQLAFAGGTWAPGLLGLPAVLPGVLSLVLWTVVFAVLARRNLRWDPRSV
jgi:ABC-2 type transport system permease protein